MWHLVWISLGRWSAAGESTAVSRAKELVKDMEKEACRTPGWQGERVHDISWDPLRSPMLKIFKPSLNLELSLPTNFFTNSNVWEQLNQHPTSSNIIQHHPTYYLDFIQFKPLWLLVVRSASRKVEISSRFIPCVHRSPLRVATSRCQALVVVAIRHSKDIVQDNHIQCTIYNKSI